MPERARLLAAVAVTVLIVAGNAVSSNAVSSNAAVSGTGSRAGGPAVAEVSRGVPVPAFYRPPVALPRVRGALIRSEPLHLAVRLPGLNGPMPGTATRLMYASQDSTGRWVAVTGAVVEPSRSWPGGGPRPLVVVAPGTLGQGDQCAASLGLEHPVRVLPSTVTAGYEDVAVYRLLQRGIGVVITDYVGLGTTDRLHTFVNRVDEAHAVLDAARAARALRPALARSPVGLYGYSQGGGATAAAAELQPSYAPDVRIAGTYAGAPPADLAEVTRAIDGSDLAAALAWAVNGFGQSRPALRPLFYRYVNAAGRAALADASTMCVGEALLRYGSVHSTAWTTDGRSVGDIVHAVPALRAVFAQQLIGTRRPAGPVRVATALRDDLVPHAQARAMALAWCRLGGNVTYVPIMLPPLGRALLNHFAALVTDQGAAISWLTDRLSGKPAPSTCPTLPARP
ncbi:MAG TPA: lipase family protein [Kineosporiaceae bacterium]